MSICHQHSHPASKYFSNVILHPRVEVWSQWWEIGTSSIRCKINRSSKPVLKLMKLHLKPLLSQNNLLSYLTASYICCSHVTYLKHQLPNYLSILSVHMPSSLSVIVVIFLSTFTCKYFRSTFFSRGSSLVATESHITYTTCTD